MCAPDTIGRLHAVEEEAEQIIELFDALGGRRGPRQLAVLLDGLDARALDLASTGVSRAPKK